jgi:hypothetical protein
VERAERGAGREMCGPELLEFVRAGIPSDYGASRCRPIVSITIPAGMAKIVRIECVEVRRPQSDPALAEVDALLWKATALCS